MSKRIPLFIERSGITCSEKCPFLQTEGAWDYKTGSCLLFQQALRQKFGKNGEEVWETCDQCDKVVDNFKNLV